MDQAEMHRRLDADGFFVVPAVLDPQTLARVRDALDRGVEVMKRMMGSAHLASLDPNEANQRVVNLPAIDPVFIELLRRPDVLGAVEAILGPHYLVSNFTANIAHPGSGSMQLHSDQALVVPPPWNHSWAMNIIWCINDVHEANGATRYLPGSHRFRSFEEVPADAIDRTVAFEAPAGSFIAMEGRLWHTSGRNVSAHDIRRMMFAYYSSDFIRQQSNWAFTLPQEVQAGMDADTRRLFGLSPVGNARIGAALTQLKMPA